MNKVAATVLSCAVWAAQGASSIDSDAAIELARTELAQRLKVAAEQFDVVRIEPAQWSDSSLGCPRSGSQYMQVISDGHVVVLAHAGREHEVHVSGRKAVLCDRPPAGTLKLPTRAQGLQDVSARARKDLANKLQLPLAEVRVMRMEPQRWADASLGCPSAGTNSPDATQQAVSGYRLHLNASGRTYTYHTDLKNVFACPPLEAE